ncbi:CU044_5270 family protein [Streptomyces sp. 8N616]|uniref:CU044_5270 family protein n=1 Tax=Streptomyces sp. 8N616 TaxID=3457414 RepID=UPI003FD00124
MDEMTTVCELRAGVPNPDRVRLETGRRRLLDAAVKGRRARRLRTDWRLAVAGVAAAITAVAVSATNLGNDPVGEAAKPYTRLYQTGSASKVLEQAAGTVEWMPAPEPEDDQWIYVKSVHAFAANTDPRPKESEYWVRFGTPDLDEGDEDDDHSLREEFRFMSELPDDPEQVLKKVRGFYPTSKESPESRAQHEFRALGLLINSYPVPPEGLAKVYRALAAVKGVAVVDHLVEDVTGREAIALYLKGKGDTGLRNEILIDPVSFAYLGSRYVAAADQKGDGSSGTEWKTGDVISSTAIKEAALVGERGKRP